MSEIIEELSTELNRLSISFEQNASLKKILSYRTGGNASLFILPQNERDLILLNGMLSRKEANYILINGGSNLLISDKGFDIVIYPKIKNSFDIIESNENFSLLKVNAFSSNRFISEAALNLSLTGAEFLSTIPGKIGGGIYQNAGCYGYDISMITERIEYIENEKIHSISKEEADFSYRSSTFQRNNNRWIANAVFRLNHEKKEIIAKRQKDFITRRIESQPKNRKSAGSVFRNPKGEYKAWQLIDKSGLRGYQKGGAKFSEKHSNFIINENNASAQDIYSLIELAKEKVYNKFSIQLQPEIQILGDFD